MNESIQKYFKIGVVQFMSFPPALEETLHSIKAICCDAFFDAIEITQMKDDNVRMQAKQLLAQSHLEVCYCASPRLMGPKLNPNSLSEDERGQAESTLLEAVDEAEYLGAGGIAFLAGKWNPQDKEEHYRQLLKTTVNVCKYAAAKNMTVELEVFDFDFDKAALIGPAPYAARFAADVRCQCNNFGLLLDLSHIPLTYESNAFCIRTLRPYITHLHIGNAVMEKGSDAYGDLHPRFGYPNGCNDVNELKDFFEKLKAEGFFCAEAPLVLSVEVTPRPGEDPSIVLASSKRVINRAWAIAE